MEEKKDKQRRNSVRAVTHDRTEKHCVDGWWERREGTDAERRRKKER